LENKGKRGNYALTTLGNIMTEDEILKMDPKFLINDPEV
jgi:hypothetical protein